MPDDPHPNKARFVGKACSFEHAGKTLVGVIEAQSFTGYTERGAIPDYLVTIRGKSGKALTVSFVESRLSLRDQPQ